METVFEDDRLSHGSALGIACLHIEWRQANRPWPSDEPNLMVEVEILDFCDGLDKRGHGVRTFTCPCQIVNVPRYLLEGLCPSIAVFRLPQITWGVLKVGLGDDVHVRFICGKRDALLQPSIMALLKAIKCKVSSGGSNRKGDEIRIQYKK